ncbi:hypothetical protein SEA_BRAXOADDIE_93 [Rhodococcus phage Braxoaddie]|nr:hypothetical protein SEA_BRAXOADDIE_93 [Rhodococcus phage Braxoaddie]
MARYTRTAREAIRQDGEFNGWTIERRAGAVSLATGPAALTSSDVFTREGVTVTVTYTGTGAVKSASRDRGPVGDCDIVNGRDTGKRETVRAWLAADREPVTVTADDIDDAPVCANDGEPVAREGMVCERCASAAREYDDITRAALRAERTPADVAPAPVREPIDVRTRRARSGATRDALAAINGYRAAYGAGSAITLADDGERVALDAIARAYGWTVNGPGEYTREGDAVRVLTSDRPGNPVTSARYDNGADPLAYSVGPRDARRCDVVASWLTAPIVRVIAERDTASDTATDEDRAMAHVRVGSFRTFGEARDAIVSRMRSEADRLAGERFAGEPWCAERIDAIRAGALTFDALACDPLDGEPTGSDVHTVTAGLRWTLRAFTRDPGAALAFRGNVRR